MRDNIDAFVASVAYQLVDLDVLEVGAGALDSNEAAFVGNRYRRTDRDTLDLLGDVPAEMADVVVATEVLEHIPDPPRALANCWTLLRPGGALVISVPWEYPEHGDEDYWRFSELGLDLLLACAGFAIERRANAYVDDRKTNLFRVARKGVGDA